MSIRLHATVLLMALLLSACGAKIVKDAPPPPMDRVIAEAASPHARAQVAWVLVSEGPGSWAEEAVWDEYLIRVRNTSAAPLEVVGAVVQDSSGHDAAPLASRKELIQASKATARRYKEQGVSVYAGLGGASMVKLGAGSVAAGIAYPSLVAGSWTTVGVTLGLVVTGPVLGTIGFVRASRARKMDKRIHARQTPLPLTIPPGEEVVLDLFFPIMPAPNSVTIGYRQDGVENAVAIDTRQALAGLHLPPPDAAKEAPRKVAPDAAPGSGP